MNTNVQNEIAKVEQLEAALRFVKFDSETAHAIGMDVVESARAGGKVIEIDIEYEDHCVFHYAMTGWLPAFADWSAGKKIVQKTCGCASMLVYWKLQAEGRKFSEKYPQHTDLDGVAAGGGFPIRLAGDDTIKGWITVTGLPHFEDHQLVVNALQRVLGKVPQTTN